MATLKADDTLEKYKNIFIKKESLKTALSKLINPNNTTLTSILISGQGGTGKTYSVIDFFNKNQKMENEDYVLLSGYSTAKGLYELLYKYKDDFIIVLDDCDSVLNDLNSVSILKAALDSKPKRYISWILSSQLQNKQEKEKIPTLFSFTSKVIIITNKPRTSIDEALLTRTILYDLHLNPEDIIEYAKTIQDDLLSNIDSPTREKIFNVINKYYSVIPNFSLRTFIKLNQIIDNSDSEDSITGVIANII